MNDEAFEECVRFLSRSMDREFRAALYRGASISTVIQVMNEVFARTIVWSWQIHGVSHEELLQRLIVQEIIES